jgi:hypothetical protein
MTTRSAILRISTRRREMGPATPTPSEDRESVRDLLARYALYIDSGQADEWVALFTEDGVFEVGHGMEPAVGRDALKAFASSLEVGAMHHLFTDQVIDIEADRATCTATAIVLSKGSIMFAGRSYDELERVDGSWRIRFRSYTVDPT